MVLLLVDQINTTNSMTYEVTGLKLRFASILTFEQPLNVDESGIDCVGLQCPDADTRRGARYERHQRPLLHIFEGWRV